MKERKAQHMARHNPIQSREGGGRPWAQFLGASILLGLPGGDLRTPLGTGLTRAVPVVVAVLVPAKASNPFNSHQAVQLLRCQVAHTEVVPGFAPPQFMFSSYPDEQQGDEQPCVHWNSRLGFGDGGGG